MSDKITVKVVVEEGVRQNEVCHYQGNRSNHFGTLKDVEIDRTFYAVLELVRFSGLNDGWLAWWKDVGTGLQYPMSERGIKLCMRRAEWPKPGLIDCKWRIEKHGNYMTIVPLFPEDEL